MFSNGNVQGESSAYSGHIPSPTMTYSRETNLGNCQDQAMEMDQSHLDHKERKRQQLPSGKTLARLAGMRWNSKQKTVMDGTHYWVALCSTHGSEEDEHE